MLPVLQYPTMAKTMGEFTLEIKGGEFTDSEIMVMLGENGACARESSFVSETCVTVCVRVHRHREDDVHQDVGWRTETRRRR